MGIQQDVFDLFLAKLTKDKEFPRELIEELKKLCKGDEIGSEEKILEKINWWINSDSKDKGN